MEQTEKIYCFDCVKRRGFVIASCGIAVTLAFSIYAILSNATADKILYSCIYGLALGIAGAIMIGAISSFFQYCKISTYNKDEHIYVFFGLTVMDVVFILYIIINSDFWFKVIFT